MTQETKLLIEPLEGFTPHIGVFVSVLQTCRQETLRLVGDLSLHQLDYVYDPNANAIGAMLLHMAALEAAFQEYTFYGKVSFTDPEFLKKWGLPLRLDHPAREQIRGHTVGYYLDELEAVRNKTLENFKKLDDDWLWKEARWTTGTANYYWMWYHVYQDEINHRGEISWLKSRIPGEPH